MEQVGARMEIWVVGCLQQLGALMMVKLWRGACSQMH